LLNHPRHLGAPGKCCRDRQSAHDEGGAGCAGCTRGAGHRNSFVEDLPSHPIEFLPVTRQPLARVRITASCSSVLVASAEPCHGPGSPSIEVNRPPASSTMGTSAAMS